MKSVFEAKKSDFFLNYIDVVYHFNILNVPLF